MANTLKHRKVNIVTLMANEPLAEHCKPGDIAIVQDEAGWWNHFISADGTVDSYETPYTSYKAALWAAKAAAEFGF